MQIGSFFGQRLNKVQRLLPALRLVWQSSPRWTIARTSVLIIQGILPLFSIYLVKLIIDSVAQGFTSGNRETVFQHVLGLLVLAAVMTIITTLCNSLSELLNSAQAQRVTDYMRSVLHAKSIEVDLEYYEDPRYHDTMQRAQQEAPYRPAQLLDRLASTTQNGISLIAMVGLLLSLHWSIVSVLFIAAIPAVLVRMQYTRVLYHWQREWTPIERQSLYLGWMLTTDSFAKEIRLFGLGELFSQQFDQLRNKIFQARLSLLTRRSISFFFANALAGLFLFAIYGFIIYQTLQGTLKLGDLVLYHQALQRGQDAIRALVTSLTGLHEDNLFLANLYEFLDLKPNIITPAVPKAIAPKLQKGIVFDQVSFGYANSQRKAIKEVSFTVRPGETIALVGENGSGKTTLIKLLCRLYDPTSGRITIDGVDVRDVDVAELRQKISVIFQDYAKYNFSAEENIWLGNITVASKSESVVAAARQSGADPVIRELPQGYDTILGKLFDSGEELSIGQWQKVALARAFLRESQVIVLDEPTSAMDPKAEYEIFSRFRELIQDQAAILITHRLSTVKMADRIYVMDHGSIVEHGTHDELMQFQGLYAHLFETQAQNYR